MPAVVSQLIGVFLALRLRLASGISIDQDTFGGPVKIIVLPRAQGP
jgi:hypothetical protein